MIQQPKQKTLFFFHIFGWTDITKIGLGCSWFTINFQGLLWQRSLWSRGQATGVRCSWVTSCMLEVGVKGLSRLQSSSRLPLDVQACFFQWLFTVSIFFLFFFLHLLFMSGYFLVFSVGMRHIILSLTFWPQSAENFKKIVSGPSAPKVTIDVTADEYMNKYINL